MRMRGADITSKKMNGGGYLSLDDTLLCKGIAIFIMLFHHLFWRQDSWGDFWWCLHHNGYPLISFLAYHGKVCVTIFVLLSGYGMALSYKKRVDMRECEDVLNFLKVRSGFVLQKIKKLYLMYWPIFTLSVVVCAVIGIHSPKTIYDSLGQGIRDFFAVAYIFDGVSPFNGAWWYISLALILYLFHPFIQAMAKRFPKICLIVSFAIGVNPVSSIAIIKELRRYLFVYVLGVILADKNWLNRIADFDKKWTLMIPAITNIAFLIVRVFWPFTFDGFLSLGIVVIFTELSKINKPKWLWRWIKLVGEHSGNIFLIHGILYKFLLHDFIYSLYYPSLIWTILLALSLGISVTIQASGTLGRNILKGKLVQ